MLTNIFADKALSDRLIRIVRQSLVDPNFLSVSCQNLAELMSKREGPQGLMMETRKLALRHFLQEMVDDMLHSSNGNPSKWDHHVLRFLEEKSASNTALLDIYTGDAGEERRREFYHASRAAWTVHLPSALSKLESMMVGPFALGDDLVSTKRVPSAGV